MGFMTDDERDEFVAERRVAVLAIERDGKAPLLAPIWYRYTPETGFEICMANDSVKARRIRATGRASICIQDESRPYRYVTADGPAETRILTPSERDDILRNIAQRYLGERSGSAYADAFPGHDEALVTIQPDRWRAEFLG
jgi:PPOX class probable F420-dependent enzyme